MLVSVISSTSIVIEGSAVAAGEWLMPEDVEGTAEADEWLMPEDVEGVVYIELDLFKIRVTAAFIAIFKLTFLTKVNFVELPGKTITKDISEYRKT